MRIFGLGIDYRTGDLLLPPQDESEFGSRIREALQQKSEEVRSMAMVNTIAPSFRGEVERRRSRDLHDPRVAGWTFLVRAQDPRRDEIVEAMRPLAEHRGMSDPSAPLLFDDEEPDDWFDWLTDNYTSLGTGEVPYYILIVGGPTQVPFKFQSLLDSVAASGRLDFESMDELRAYVSKILRLERGDGPVVERSTFFFAPDGGPNDATHFSRQYLATPLAGHVRDRLGLPVSSALGLDATKEQLSRVLREHDPALVFTASHGLAAPSESLAVQMRVNGGICCQHSYGAPQDEWLFSADDIPRDEPFLEGSVFFQFACFGGGTPRQSDFMHWLGDPAINGEEDFVAAIPKALLGNERGPIAVVAHVDTAWMHGFEDPNEPHLIERWHGRIEPFVRAVDSILSVEPVGHALSTMHKRYNSTNAVLTNAFDRLRRGKSKISTELHERLAEVFVTRSDAQNYIVLGDPAARLRIPT